MAMLYIMQVRKWSIVAIKLNMADDESIGQIVCVPINSACVTKIAKWTYERFELEARISTKLLQDAAFSV
jgi:hypothetical protein